MKLPIACMMTLTVLAAHAFASKASGAQASPMQVASRTDADRGTGQGNRKTNPDGQGGGTSTADSGNGSEESARKKSKKVAKKPPRHKHGKGPQIDAGGRSGNESDGQDDAGSPAPKQDETRQKMNDESGSRSNQTSQAKQDSLGGRDRDLEKDSGGSGPIAPKDSGKQSLPKSSGDPVEGTPKTAGQNTFSGNASWYGIPFHGRKTASGEIFNMYRLSAAHKKFRLPTWALVEDPRSGNAVIVKINDRGPYVKNRVLDLSREAARRLGTMQRGVAYVEGIIIDRKTAAGARP